MSDRVHVSEYWGPLGAVAQEFEGPNGRKRFEEFKLWQKKVTVETPPAPRRLTRMLFSGVGMRSTHGREVLWASSVFTGSCDPQFTAGEVDESTPYVQTDVEEVAESGFYSQIYRGFGREIPVFTRSQITRFCDDHSNLFRHGCVVIFRMKGHRVANVRRGEKGLELRVRQFSNVVIPLDLLTRVVVPQVA